MSPRTVSGGVFAPEYGMMPGPIRLGPRSLRRLSARSFLFVRIILDRFRTKGYQPLRKKPFFPFLRRIAV